MFVGYAVSWAGRGRHRDGNNAAAPMTRAGREVAVISRLRRKGLGS